MAQAQIPDAMRAVLKRASLDREFRARLLSDPRTALWREFGIHVPEQYRLRFVERDPDVDALIVLPDLATEEKQDGELTDDALERVWGGTGGEGEHAWADEPPPPPPPDEPLPPPVE